MHTVNTFYFLFMKIVKSTLLFCVELLVCGDDGKKPERRTRMNGKIYKKLEETFFT